jgi:hypothetical protein
MGDRPNGAFDCLVITQFFTVTTQPPSPSATVTISPTETVQLNPSYAIPIVLVLAAMPLVLFNPWISGAIALFGLFLLLQAVTLRLTFTESALDIYRSTQLIRRFPYQDWQTWRIFWPGFPVLLYFKEVKSIHFVPVLFDPKMLEQCLMAKCGSSAPVASSPTE